MFITVTASKGEIAKEVMHRKCQTSSSSSASSFSYSKLESLSLTHQPNFETCEKLVSLSFGVEETNCSQCIFQLSNGHELLRFHRRLVIVQTRQFAYGHAVIALDNPLTAIN